MGRTPEFPAEMSMASGGQSANNVQPTDASAASQWLSEHGDTLFRYARARVAGRELAEDLVQETFLAAVAASASLSGRINRTDLADFDSAAQDRRSVPPHAADDCSRAVAC